MGKEKKKKKKKKKKKESKNLECKYLIFLSGRSAYFMRVLG